MSQFQDLARRLVAAGSAIDPEGKTTHLLYTNTSSIISKHWTGKSFSSPAHVAKSVRPDSTTAYLLTPTIQLVIYISSASQLHVIRYDDDGDEWGEDEIPDYGVHHDGKVAACLDDDGHVLVFFPDRSKTLWKFDLDSMSVTEIPLDLLVGSPLWTSVISGRLHVFYISAENCMHYATEINGSWHDTAWSTDPFQAKIKQFIVIPKEEESQFEAYVLTEEGVLLQIAVGGNFVTVGRVDDAGKFMSERSIDLCCIDAQNNTLTEERLEKYLAEDSSIIDSVGGPKSATPLATACLSGSLDAVCLLLDNPIRLADPNAVSPQNRTPLYYAILRSPAHRKEMVSALLDAGAHVDKGYAEDDFNTPLMNAVADTVDTDVIHELVDRGASLTVKNAQGQTAMMLAEGSGMELELRPLKERKLCEVVEKTHSIQREFVDVLVAIVMLIVAYIDSDFLRDIVSRAVARLQGMSEFDEDEEPEQVSN